MDEIKKAPIPVEELDKATGGGEFDDVPRVDEHPYDSDTKKKA